MRSHGLAPPDSGRHIQRPSSWPDEETCALTLARPCWAGGWGEKLLLAGLRNKTSNNCSFDQLLTLAEHSKNPGLVDAFIRYMVLQGARAPRLSWDWVVISSWFNRQTWSPLSRQRTASPSMENRIFFSLKKKKSLPSMSLQLLQHAYSMKLYFCIQEDSKQNYRKSLRLGTMAEERRRKKKENLGRLLGGGGIQGRL